MMSQTVICCNHDNIMISWRPLAGRQSSSLSKLVDLAGPLPLSDLWRVYTRSPLAQWSPLLSKSCWTACTREEETGAREDGEFANTAHFNLIISAATDE